MKSGLWFLWLVVLAVCGTGIALAGRAEVSAKRNAGSEVNRFNLLVEQGRTLSRLRGLKPAWADSPVAGQEVGLAPSVSAVLASCGLPASTLSSLSPETNVASVGPLKVQRQHATLTLTAITLPQLGTFLEAWRKHEPAWVTSSIEITSDGGRPTNPATPGGDLPLRAVMAIETLRLQSAGGER